MNICNKYLKKNIACNNLKYQKFLNYLKAANNLSRRIYFCNFKKLGLLAFCIYEQG